MRQQSRHSENHLHCCMNGISASPLCCSTISTKWIFRLPFGSFLIKWNSRNAFLQMVSLSIAMGFPVLCYANTSSALTCASIRTRVIVLNQQFHQELFLSDNETTNINTVLVGTIVEVLQCQANIIHCSHRRQSRSFIDDVRINIDILDCSNDMWISHWLLEKEKARNWFGKWFSFIRFNGSFDWKLLKALKALHAQEMKPAVWFVEND